MQDYYATGGVPFTQQHLYTGQSAIYNYSSPGPSQTYSASSLLSHGT